MNIFKTSIINRILLALLVCVWMTMAGCGNVSEDSETGGTGTSSVTGGSATTTVVGDFSTLTIQSSKSVITVGDAISVKITATCNAPNSPGVSQHCRTIGGETWFSARPTSRTDLIAGSVTFSGDVVSSRHLAFSTVGAENRFNTTLAGGLFDNPSTTTVDEFTPGEVIQEISLTALMNSTVKGKATFSVTFEDVTATIFIDIFEDVTSSINP